MVVDVGLDDAPAGLRGAQQQLQGIAEALVGDRQAQQVGAAGGPHRTEVVHPHAAPAQPPGDDRVAEPGVRRPGPRGGGAATAENEIGAPGRELGDEVGQLGRVQRGVGVADADHVRVRGEQSGVHGRAVAAARHVDDDGAALAGDARRAVAGAVVGDDGPVAGRHPIEDPGQRLGLVQAGEHDVDRRRLLVTMRDHDRDSSDGRVPPTLTKQGNPLVEGRSRGGFGGGSYEPVTGGFGVVRAAPRRFRVAAWPVSSWSTTTPLWPRSSTDTCATPDSTSTGPGTGRRRCASPR
ncbi:hypothetical protein FRACA_80019 [Frankia canadensis]|uniref:Uncharacterized protein n=1 Tax=Frankia canadensis TaxID=1836972 RepID=A0A2I2L1D8_9ACTN|nr:hypothetical protein FRACA_80019 [Frankia canadensis]SOU59009.1 hypothetical protein FRACA_80019 [Frankia canadensis]